MAPINLPVVFGSIAAGAVVIDYGLKSTKAAFAAAPAAGAGGAAGAPGAAAPGGAVGVVGPGGMANPFPGAHVTSLDAGLDLSMAPGSPIFAPVGMTLHEIIGNWYSGQPLYLYQTDSPVVLGGHGWYYVAEQFAGTGKIGDHFAAGQQIGTFAQSGTGIEAGIGDPSSNARTLAGALGQGDGGHAGTTGSKIFQQVLQSITGKLPTVGSVL